MFNQTLVPSRTSNSTYPIPRPTAIKLIFKSGRIDCQIRRDDRGPKQHRYHGALTPASVNRIAQLADRLATFQGWLAWLNRDGWLVTSPTEVIK